MTSDPRILAPFLGCAAMGATLTVVGLRGAVLRRPFLMQGSLFVFLVGLGPLSIVFSWLSFIGPLHFQLDHITLFQMAWPLRMVVLIGVIARQLQGFIGFGMSTGAFVEALRGSAATLGLELDESLSAFSVRGHDARFEVAVQGWVGTAQIRPTTREAKRMLPSIAAAMNHQFKDSKQPARVAACITYATLGLGLLAIVTWFAAAWNAHAT